MRVERFVPERHVAGRASDRGGERHADELARSGSVPSVSTGTATVAAVPCAGDQRDSGFTVDDGFSPVRSRRRLARRPASARLRRGGDGFLRSLLLGALRGARRVRMLRKPIAVSKPASFGRSGAQATKRSTGEGSGTSSCSVTSSNDSRALSGILDQHVAPLARLHRRGGGEHGLQITELVDQLGGALGSDAGHARHVVGAVADQRLHVDASSPGGRRIFPSPRPGRSASA